MGPSPMNSKEMLILHNRSSYQTVVPLDPIASIDPMLALDPMVTLKKSDLVRLKVAVRMR